LSRKPKKEKEKIVIIIIKDKKRRGRNGEGKGGTNNVYCDRVCFIMYNLKRSISTQNK